MIIKVVMRKPDPVRENKGKLNHNIFFLFYLANYKLPMYHLTRKEHYTGDLIYVSQGPFDGVLGFSQGASFVSLLCALKEQEAGKTSGSISPNPDRFRKVWRQFAEGCGPPTRLYGLSPP